MNQQWEESDGIIKRIFSFASYMAGVTFALKVAHIAETMDHHPDILIEYKTITVSATTHEAGNTVTDKDRKLAMEIDNVYSGN